MLLVLLLVLFSAPGVMLALYVTTGDTSQPHEQTAGEPADIRAINAVLDERIELLDSHALGQDDFTRRWLEMEDALNITIHYADARAAYQIEQEHNYEIGPELLEWLIARHIYRTGLNVQDRLEAR